MAMPGSIQDRNYAKFVETASGETAVRVLDDHVKSGLSGSLLQGVVYDYGSVAYPVNTTEVYTFRNGGASGTIVATITLIYTSSSKQNLSTFEVVKP